MSETPAGSNGKNQKILVIFGGVILLALLIVIILLSLAQANQKKAAAATLQAIPVQSTQVIAEENTPEAVATVTTAIFKPEGTPTNVPPTATEAAPLAIAENGLQIRCLAINSSLPIDTATSFSDTFFAVSEIAPKADGIKLTIPVRACAVFVTFTQPLNEEVQVEVFQASDTQAWYTRPLVKDEQSENTYFAVLSHQYIIDPPYWNLNYRMRVHGPTQTYWENALSVSRIFNGLCWEGSVPDPVTLKCPDADKLEREPHLDMPTLVPGGIQN